MHLLDLSGDADRGEHFANTHPWNELCCECGGDRFAAWRAAESVQLFKRRRMHCTSLANLKCCEVEAERLNLPLELQQFAVGGALQAIGGECFAKLPQLTHKVTRICVRPFAPLLRAVDAELSCAPEAFSNCAEPASVRLVREALSQDALGVAKITCVALECCRERSWDRIF